MSFGDFTLTSVQAELGLRLHNSQSLFEGVRAVPISAELAGFYGSFLRLGIAWQSEKGRSELVIAPLMAEVWGRSRSQVSVLSGVEWVADAAAGLRGVSDFLVCRSQNLLTVSAPVLVAVESKRGDINEGLGQCIATMVGAQRFNAAADTQIDPLYGCVTIGSLWKFLRLSGQTIDVDIDEYSIHQPDRILGVLLHCCGVGVAA